MCGRFGIKQEIIETITDELNIDFNFEVNNELCPSQKIPAFAYQNNKLQQLEGSWGIQPTWSKKLLINAQIETANSKPTFKNSFEQHRCVIPMSHWFEWSQYNSTDKKIKYQFSHPDNKPLFMGGLFYLSESGNQIVSLTTAPNLSYSPYHHRMPLVVNGYGLEWLKKSYFEIENKQALKISP